MPVLKAERLDAAIERFGDNLFGRHDGGTWQNTILWEFIKAVVGNEVIAGKDERLHAPQVSLMRRHPHSGSRLRCSPTLPTSA
jgi:hypothetical protein